MMMGRARGAAMQGGSVVMKYVWFGFSFIHSVEPNQTKGSD